MNTRSVLNLLLLLLVILLTTWVYHKQTATDPVSLLTSLQREAITSIVIPRDKADIVLKKTGDSWNMLSPYKLRAHDFRVERLIDLATSVVDKQYDSNILQLEKFGITETSTRIQFNDTVIRYGDINPVNQRRYVLVNQHLSLIDDQLYPLIRSQPSSFVDLALLDTEQTIQQIVLPELRIYKNTQGSWTTQPVMRIAADRLQEFVDDWQGLQAFGVHAYMSRQQLGEIELHLQDNSVIQLNISATSPWLILGRPELGIEYHLDKSFSQRLLKLQTEQTESKQAEGSNDA